MIKEGKIRFIVANIRGFAQWKVELAGIPSAGDRLRSMISPSFAAKIKCIR
jgi:hypothetical protein